MSGIWLCLGVTFHTYRGQGLLNLLESVYNFYQILKNFVYDTFIYVYFFFCSCHLFSLLETLSTHVLGQLMFS
jgi:hypothetical protein